MTESNGLSRLGEFEIIDRLRSKFGDNKYVVIPSGDDAAVVDMPDGDVVIGTDADKFATYQDGAAKSALASDILGKAGTQLLALFTFVKSQVLLATS